MRSPIARGLRAASRLAEWAHRTTLGPQYAPGDVVLVQQGARKIYVTLQREWKTGGAWDVYRTEQSAQTYAEDAIIRVVRYGEGE